MLTAGYVTLDYRSRSNTNTNNKSVKHKLNNKQINYQMSETLAKEASG
jgi:hypothetical protein